MIWGFRCWLVTWKYDADGTGTNLANDPIHDVLLTGSNSLKVLMTL
jgi:hypothetical protein